MSKTKPEIRKESFYQNLQERCSEMSSLISALVDDNNYNETELRYLKEYIRYKELDDEYRYFRVHAHEEHDADQPFSFLTL